MNASHDSACILGGGIAGLASALALSRQGLKVRVFERAAAISEVGAGLQLGPNAVMACRKLGVAEAVQAVANRPGAVNMLDGLTGRQLMRFPLGDVIEARLGAPFLNIHRADLIDVLARAATEAGVEICLGHTAVDAEPDPIPTVRFEDGRRETASLIIGADGVRSLVRKARFGGIAPRFTGHVAWRALIERPRDWSSDVTVWMAPDRHVVVYPLREDLLNIVAVERNATETPESWRVEGSTAEMRQRFGKMARDLRDLLEQVAHVFTWGLYAHPPLERWSNGGLALIGDACHPMLPFFAQGAGMALEDAAVLGACLGQGADVPAGLAEYGRLRGARVLRVQNASVRNGRLYHATGVMRLGRNIGMPWVNRLAPGFVARRFDWLYRGDPTL